MDGHPRTADVFSPTTADELARFVADNAAGKKRPLSPVGGRTALHFGYPRSEQDVTIVMEDLNRVIDYPARDMTITLEAGLRVEELQKMLAVEGQRLPIDVPQAHRATIGGAIATNTSGPGRFGHGTFRDYVIGISAVDGRGRLFSAGGRVVKNVAGYDLCKLLVGSLGTLGIITQVTLKLRPLAASRQALWLTFDHAHDVEPVLQQLLTSETRPVAIEVLNPAAVRQVQRESKLDLPIDRFVLCVAYEGGPAETDWQINTLKQEVSTATGNGAATFADEQVVLAGPCGALWSALTEYQAASDDPLTFQAAVPPSRAMTLVDQATRAGVAVQAHAGNGIVIGHLPDRCTTPDEAEQVLAPLRRTCLAAGGSLVVLGCDDAWKSQLSLFGPRQPSQTMSQQIKSALDPDNVLNPGRIPLGEPIDHHRDS